MSCHTGDMNPIFCLPPTLNRNDFIDDYQNITSIDQIKDRMRYLQDTQNRINEQIEYLLSQQKDINEKMKLLESAINKMSSEMTIIFKRKIGNNENEVNVKCFSNEKISSVINKYKAKINDFKNYIYVFNAIKVNPDLTVEQTGLRDNGYLFVLEENNN